MLLKAGSHSHEPSHSSPARTASCSCGQLKVHIAGEPVRISVCHCLACQRRTGNVFATQARFSRAGAKIVGESIEYVRAGDEGGGATFRFCPKCGAIVHYTNAGDEETITIPVGAFADPSFPAPTVSVYEQRMHAWVTMPSEMEHID